MATINNVPSGAIRIFPSSSRGAASDQYGNNFVTEYNLASLIDRITDPDQNGFLITTEILAATNVFEFNIKGYFVQTTVADIMNAVNGTSASSSYYENFVYFTESSDGIVSAHINLKNEENKNDDSFTCLDGEETTESSSDKDMSDSISLELFSVSGSTYTPCENSFLRILTVSDSIDKLFTNKLVGGNAGVEFTITDGVITDMIMDDGEI